MNKANWEDERNLSMLMDFYELTMSNGLYVNGMKDVVAVFDMYFRRVPDDGGFAIFAGLEQLIHYLENLSFTERDIEFLRSKKVFDEGFLKYLADFRFECDVWSMEEGTPVFPNEPIVTVKGPVVQAMLVETMVLLTVNHQSLIATKANRVVRAAEGRPVMEFGSRRAQSYDAAIFGARAAYIGGCSSSALTMIERDYQIPAVGTMAHSWVQMFDSEYEAIKSYAEIYPDSCTLLVDTYNTLRSGMPNAIKVFDEVVVPAGFRPKGIRIDSGDIAYLSKKCRAMLDAAGYKDVKIVASNSLDEYIIRDLLLQDAQIDTFGVGEKLITSKTEPVFGGVYKLVAVEENGTYIPRIKISETADKITTPGFKKPMRIYDKNQEHAIADYIACNDEVLDKTKPLTLFDPISTWKKRTVRNFEFKELMVPVFEKGKLVYNCPDVHAIQKYCLSEIDTLWDEVKRFDNPHRYYVDLSLKLWQMKENLLRKLNINVNGNGAVNTTTDPV